MVRVALTAALGYAGRPRGCRELLGIDRRWGAAALTAFSGVAACVEFLLLRRGLSRRVGAVDLPRWYLARLWFAATAAAAAAWLVKVALPPVAPLVRGLATLGPFGVAYLGLSAALGISQARSLWTRLARVK